MGGKTKLMVEHKFLLCAIKVAEKGPVRHQTGRSPDPESAKRPKDE